jgi:hypothetical protein
MACGNDVIGNEREALDAKNEDRLGRAQVMMPCRVDDVPDGGSSGAGHVYHARVVNTDVTIQLQLV